MRKQWLLIVLVTACITVSLSFAACTYDYFEDETNYIVYVPEVRDKAVTDCRVMIYNESGELIGDKTANSTSKDPRLQEGLFAFRLMPGDYKVYCYANTDSVVFTEEPSLGTAAFKLPAKADGVYQQPSDVFYDILEHKVQHQGVLLVDTTAIERYVGRITVRFKNFPVNLSSLSHVDLLAERVASMQYLEKDTLTSYAAQGDVMTHTDAVASIPFSGSSFELDHRYFPSVDDSDYEILNFTFIDSGGNVLTSVRVDVADPATYTPIRLYHGKRIIIEIDRYLINSINLVGWDEDIQDGGGVGVW